MEITDAMHKYIEAALDIALDKSYPNSDRSATYRGKVKLATFNALRHQKDSALSAALRMAAEAAEQLNAADAATEPRYHGFACPECGRLGRVKCEPPLR